KPNHGFFYCQPSFQNIFRKPSAFRSRARPGAPRDCMATTPLPRPPEKTQSKKTSVKAHYSFEQRRRAAISPLLQQRRKACDRCLLPIASDDQKKSLPKARFGIRSG
ncbi:MAG: hypothetical protein ACN6OP_27385, partial [Pseudomonadales bacterium]